MIITFYDWKERFCLININEISNLVFDEGLTDTRMLRYRTKDGSEYGSYITEQTFTDLVSQLIQKSDIFADNLASLPEV